MSKSESGGGNKAEESKGGDKEAVNTRELQGRCGREVGRERAFLLHKDWTPGGKGRGGMQTRIGAQALLEGVLAS